MELGPGLSGAEVMILSSKSNLIDFEYLKTKVCVLSQTAESHKAAYKRENPSRLSWKLVVWALCITYSAWFVESLT